MRTIGRAPWLTLLAKAALGVAALVALGSYVEGPALRDALRGASLGWAALASLLLPLNLWLEAYRWFRLVRRQAPRLRQRDALAAVLAGYPLGLLTPGRVGDYAGRALSLRGAPGAGTPGRTVSGWDAATLTFAERMATLACCLAFGLVALAHFLVTRSAMASYAWTAILWVGLLATGAFLGLMLHPRLAWTVLTTLLPFRVVRRRLAVVARFRRRDAAALMGLSAVRYAVFSAQFVLLVRAFAPSEPWGAATWGAAAAGVALAFFAKSAIPSPTLGDLGVREGAAVYFLGAYGLAEAAAFNASLGLFALNLLLPALAGLPLALRLRWRTDAEPARATDPAAAPAASRTS